MEPLKLLTMVIYVVGFGTFTVFVGRALRSRGRVFLENTFSARPAVADSVDFLLALGFYILCLGLLLWNIGLEPTGTWQDGTDIFEVRHVVQNAALRLGVSIFVVGAFHTLNILILSILNRNAAPLVAAE